MFWEVSNSNVVFEISSFVIVKDRNEDPIQNCFRSFWEVSKVLLHEMFLDFS
jgi:hypothetical protein